MRQYVAAATHTPTAHHGCPLGRPLALGGVPELVRRGCSSAAVPTLLGFEPPLVRCRAQPAADLRLAEPALAHTTPSTGHTPVLWFHRAQIERATAAGIDMESVRAAGPSPYPDGGDLDAAVGPGPATAAELFTDASSDGSSATWSSIEHWYAKYAEQLQRAEQKMDVRLSAVPGGQDGITVDAAQTKQGLRHLVGDVSGARPSIVREELPDSNTTVNVHRLYLDAIRARLPDQEITSMLGLYGVSSPLYRARETSQCGVRLRKHGSASPH